MNDVTTMNGVLSEKLSNEKTAEAVNTMLDRLVELHEAGALDTLLQAVQAMTFLKDGLIDTMVAKNAAMASNLMELSAEAADPSMVEALRSLKELQKSGNLKTLVEASYMLSFFSNIISGSMVQRMAALLSSFVEEVSSPQIKDIMGGMTRCMSKTVTEFATTPPRPSIRNLVSLMRDPEVQMGLMFMTTLAKNMHKCVIEGYSGR
ncbi:MAG: DUF1641 domain-containing protein [Nitrospiraceae bacterium]|nr:MAG: DUF1641 domain-containing protein [Nitrospiraceae bacterium]